MTEAMAAMLPLIRPCGPGMVDPLTRGTVAAMAQASGTASADLARKGMLADPGDHFAGRFEVEFKVRVDGLDDVRARLEALGAIPFALNNSETDLFLDLADDRLARNGQSHVLRHMRPSNRVLWISKGPARDECVAMDLPDHAKAMDMLQSLGFVEQFKISKRRDIYFLDRCHVTLDEVDGLGTFVEVAAMTDDEATLPALRNTLLEAIERLGLSGAERVERSYREMLSA